MITIDKAKEKLNPIHARLDWHLRRNEKVMQESVQRWFAFTIRQIQTDLRTKFQKDTTSELTDWDYLNAQGQKIIKPATLKIMQSGGNEAYKLFQVKGAFDVLNVQAVEAANKFTADLVRQVNAETKKGIRTYISAGIKEGKSMDKISRELRPLVGLTKNQTQSVMNYRGLLSDEEKFPKLTTADIDKKVSRYANKTHRRRTQTIARTEAARAQNIGYAQGMDDLGVQQLEFSATIDERTSTSCMSLDGRKFNVKEASRIIPVHPSCRCVMLPVIGKRSVCRFKTRRPAAAPTAEIKPSKIPREPKLEVPTITKPTAVRPAVSERTLALRNELKATRLRNTKLKNNITAARARVKAIENSNAKLKRGLAESKKEVSGLKSELSGVKRDIKVLEGKIKEFPAATIKSDELLELSKAIDRSKCIPPENLREEQIGNLVTRWNNAKSRSNKWVLGDKLKKLGYDVKMRKPIVTQPKVVKPPEITPKPKPVSGESVRVEMNNTIDDMIKKRPVELGPIECHQSVAELEAAYGKREGVQYFFWDEAKGKDIYKLLKKTPFRSSDAEVMNLIEGLKGGWVNGHSYIKAGKHYVDPHLRSLGIAQKHIDKVDDFLLSLQHKVARTKLPKTDIGPVPKPTPKPKIPTRYKTQEKWIDSLSDSQKDSIGLYTESEYKLITETQRNVLTGAKKIKNLKELEIEALSYIKDIEKALDTSPQFKASIYRGMTFDSRYKKSYKEWLALEKRLDSGKAFSFDSMQSFTSSLREGQRFASFGSEVYDTKVLIQMRKAPKRSANIVKLSADETEKEVLVGADAKYTVFDKQEKIVRGTREIVYTLEEVL